MMKAEDFQEVSYLLSRLTPIEQMIAEIEVGWTVTCSIVTICPDSELDPIPVDMSSKQALASLKRYRKDILARLRKLGVKPMQPQKDPSDGR